MWNTILNNINTLILGNWKSIFFFAIGALAGVFLLSCAMTNRVVDATQEVVTDAVEYVIGTDEGETPDAE